MTTAGIACCKVPTGHLLYQPWIENAPFLTF
jgi:hypothetical protein